MPTWFWALGDMFNCAVEILIAVYYFENFIGRRKRTGRFYLVTCLVLGGVKSFFSIVYLGWPVMVSVSLLVNICLGVILYKGTRINQIFAAVYLMCYTLLSEGMAVPVVAMIVGLQPLYEAGWHRLIGAGVCNLFVFLMALLIARFRKTEMEQTPLSYKLLLVAITVTCVALTLRNTENYIEGEYSFWMIVSGVGLWVIASGIFYLFEKLMEHMQNAAHAELVNRHIARDGEMMAKLAQDYQQMREIRHDLNNHLLVIDRLAKESNSSELLEYLETHKKRVQSAVDLPQTGIPGIDAVINVKAGEGQRNGIQLSLLSDSLAGLKILPLDLCVILGNALDNALEACAGQEEDRRRILLSLKLEPHYLFIKTENPAAVLHRSAAGRFLTTKPDVHNHGLGLASIDRIVQKYGGVSEQDVADGNFVFSAMIPNREAE